MSEKVLGESSQSVTSNKHLMASMPANTAEPWISLPGAGRPDGPADDGGSGGPTTGGDWGGMQADGTANTSADEMAVVEEFGNRIVGEISRPAIQ